MFETFYPQEVVNPYPPYPPNIKENAYQKGLEYFRAFKGFGDEYEVVYSEQDIRAKIGPYIFRGIIDLVLRHKVTKMLIIIDHKTKSDASMRKDLELYKKQLYLYAHLYHSVHGEYPAQMAFNLPNSKNKKKKMIVFEFSMDEYNETLTWAEQLIDSIYLANAMDDFPGNYDEFFCRNLCGVRDSCGHKEETESGADIEGEYM